MHLRLALVALLALSVAAPAVVSATTTPQQDTIEGPAVPLPGEKKQQYREYMREAAENWGFAPRDHVFLLQKDGITWIVATDEKPKAGIATATGDVVRPEEMGSSEYGMVFASDVSVDRDGRRIAYDSLTDNTDAYVGEIVSVKTTYSQLQYLFDSQGILARHESGTLGKSRGATRLGQPPGQAARFTAINLSEEDSSRTDRLAAAALETLFTVSGEESITVGYDRTGWWIDGAETRVKLLVFPKQTPVSGSSHLLFPLDTDVQTTAKVSPTAVQQRGYALEGRVVTVTGDGIGSRISAQEMLLSVAKCAPESVTVPASPPACVPVPTDATLHAGMLVDPDSPTTMIPYAGISNKHQDVAIMQESGHYRVTGRVVSTDKIDKRLPDGYGLLVYERTRTGGVQITGDAREKASDKADRVKERLRTQLTYTSTEYEQVEEPKESRATATASPTPSPTPTASATATPDPTATPTRSPAPTETPTAAVGQNQFRLLTDIDPHANELLRGIGFFAVVIGAVIFACGVLCGGITKLQWWLDQEKKQDHLEWWKSFAMFGLLLFLPGVLLAIEHLIGYAVGVGGLIWWHQSDRSLGED